ncbi:hypothetical protein HNR16_003263 [Pseudoclavibacter chungangensis]|uniref:hypothetical protein n=1 Tax=Pseudoclavibacter chungangensis TaxID=587635 RepID=UPI0013018696|nr:hypothetical protein [Pseudoclavibacter chungangensis]NYJ68475.1 hypothetical protein [Pseudoclavibacter chungangensis]
MSEPISTTSAGLGLVGTIASAGGALAVTAVASALIWSATGVGAAPSLDHVDPGAVDDPGVAALASEIDRLTDALFSARIPAGTCRHEGGTLVDGVLPVPYEDGRYAGSVWIPGVSIAHDDGTDSAVRGDEPFDASALDGRLAFGDVTGDGLLDLAVILECDLGGVVWPANLFLYRQTPDGGLEVIGSANLGTVGDTNRSMFEEVEYLDGGFTARWIGNRHGANASPPDTALEVAVGITDDGLDLTALTERPIS